MNTKKIINVMMLLLTILVAIGELWDPTYLGGWLLGFLIAYNICLWTFSSMMDDVFELAYAMAKKLDKSKAKIEQLEALVYFANTISAKKGVKKGAKKK